MSVIELIVASVGRPSIAPSVILVSSTLPTTRMEPSLRESANWTTFSLPIWSMRVDARMAGMNRETSFTLDSCRDAGGWVEHGASTLGPYLRHGREGPRPPEALNVQISLKTWGFGRIRTNQNAARL